MKWLWIIVLLVLTFMPSLMARKKVAQATAADDTQDAYGDGSVDDDQGDSFFNFGDAEAEEVAPEPEPYFTYEAPQVKVDPVASVATATPKEEYGAPAFDLRSAVIYQTVLTNNYITGEN